MTPSTTKAAPPAAAASLTPLADCWRSFEEKCLPPGLPEPMRILVRDAFYGGSAAMFDLQRAIGSGGISPAAAGAAVRGLGAELQVYIEALFTNVGDRA